MDSYSMLYDRLKREGGAGKGIERLIFLRAELWK